MGSRTPEVVRVVFDISPPGTAIHRILVFSAALLVVDVELSKPTKIFKIS